MCNEEVEKRKEKMIKNIILNYKQIETSIVNQLFMKQDFHGTTIGTQREVIWKQLFEMIVPKKFVIEQSVFIIDSNGKVSHEVDLAIIDETYTPYIFRYGEIKFVPIEAVSVVVECKSQNIKTDVIMEWNKSIKALETSANSIVRMAGKIITEGADTQKSTRPIRILCALSKNEEVENEFDFIIIADEKSKNISISHTKDQGLFDWFKGLNFHNIKEEEITYKNEEISGIKLDEYKIEDKDGIVSLLTFNFQLNQLLMLINNPILFPHRAYVSLFNGKDKTK